LDRLQNQIVAIEVPEFGPIAILEAITVYQ
jgi:hypothetical protein